MLDFKDKKQLLEIARVSLKSYLLGKEGEMPEEITSQNKVVGRGVFVSYHSKKALRGCIGCFSSEKPLFQSIYEYARLAARDSRFVSNPIQMDELEEIQIEISVLEQPQAIEDYRQIELGKHGILVEEGYRKGVFLPQVATEFGWSIEEFWRYLAQEKAMIPFEHIQNGSASCFRFEALVFGEEH